MIALPPPLRPGDRIVVLSPSAPHAAMFPQRRRRGLEVLAAAGYEVVEAPSLHSDDGKGSSSSSRHRVEELHSAFADPRVRLVLSAIGGETANTVLGEFDLDLLAASPTWFCGYSDASAISIDIARRAGVATLVGPQLLPQFGEKGGADAFTMSSFLDMVSWDGARRDLVPSRSRIDEVLAWDRDDDRPRTASADDGPVVLVPGMGRGTSLVANLDTLLRLGGTPHQPDLAGTVLILEQAESTSPAHLESCLAQMSQWRGWDDVRGLGLGRFARSTGLDDQDQLGRVINEALGRSDIPIVAGLDVGHVDPVASVPVGVEMSMEAGDHQPRLSVRHAEFGTEATS